MKKILALGPLFIIFAAFLWSLDGFLRQNLYTLPATLVVFFEHLLGLIILAPFLFRGRREVATLSRDSWLAVFWVVIWGGVLGTIFYTKALSFVSYIPLSVVVLLQKLQPIFAISLAIIFLKERLTGRFLFWAALALAGGYLVTFPNLIPVFGTGDQTWVAALLAVGAAFAWGSSTVFGKKSLQSLRFSTLTSLRFALTALVLLVWLTTTGGLADSAQITPTQWGYLLAIVFSTGAVALFIYYYGLTRTKASVSTICEMFWPVSAVILDFFIRGTVLSPSQWVGAVMMLFAIYQASKMVQAYDQPRQQNTV